MVTQYPDSATFTIPGTPSQDLSGYWYVPEGSDYTTECRAEYNSQNGTVTMIDGKVVQYNYTLFQPQHETEIKPGTQVTVTLHDGSTITGTVKLHKNNQLNSKTWV